ncbi:MAG TPA: hypothetical protein ENI77_12550 [Nitrospirae bacterium]|nr:hypothetical protein [Nitrospirota bacterium]
MSFIKLLVLFSAICFIVVGVIVYLVKTRGWDFLNSNGETGQVADARDKDLRSRQIKHAALKEIGKAKNKLAPGSEKSSEFFRSLGQSDPKLLAGGVKKWLSQDGDGKLEK